MVATINTNPATQNGTRRNGGARFTHSIAKRLENGSIATFVPVIFQGTSFLADKLYAVRGGIKIPNPFKGAYFPMDNRFATVTEAEVKALFDIAKKTPDNVHKVRVPSLIAGNERGQGTETGYLIELVGSPEAEALAAALGVNYAYTVKVGQEGQEVDVTIQSGVILTQDLMVHLNGGWLGKIGPLPRENVPASRKDIWNPSLQELIATVKATGELPVRQMQQRRNVATVDDITAMFS